MVTQILFLGASVIQGIGDAEGGWAEFLKLVS